jgi:DNA-binding LytR/AlgR family response regulator
MQKIKIFIVEDEPLHANQLEMLIDELGYWLVGKADNAKDAIEMIAAVRPDMVLMDINLNDKKNGIDIAKRVKQLYEVPIVFITSMDDEHTYQKAKDASPIAYVHKPFSKRQLKRTIELIAKQLNNTPSSNFSCAATMPKHLSIKIDQHIKRIELAQLISIEVIDKQCKISTTETHFLVRIALKDLIHKLPASLFLQTHRSFIVNIDHIKDVNLADQTIVLSNELHIPLSRSYRAGVLARLNIA